MSDKTLAVYRANYDAIQQVRVIYQRTHKLPKNPASRLPSITLLNEYLAETTDEGEE